MSEAEKVRLRTVINGEARELDVDPAAGGGRRPARGSRHDRHQAGLRSGRLRRLYRDQGRASGDLVHPAGLRDGRGGAPDRRGPRRRTAYIPVQKAFLAHDGLQCGYCTPGFVVEAVAFYDAWRAKHGTEEPPRDTIAYALSGHLCRCGAYVGIYDAVAAACRGDFDGDAAFDYPRHEGPGEGHGAREVHRRQEARRHARRQGALELGASLTRRSGRSSLDAARAMDGVEAAIEVIEDPHRVARYAGLGHRRGGRRGGGRRDRAARRCAAIEVEYEPRPFVVEPSAALQPDAPEVFPEAKTKHPKNASEGPIPPGELGGQPAHAGDQQVALAARSPRTPQKHLAKARDGKDGLILVDRVYHTGGQTHTTLEPHGAIA